MVCREKGSAAEKAQAEAQQRVAKRQRRTNLFSALPIVAGNVATSIHEMWKIMLVNKELQRGDKMQAVSAAKLLRSRRVAYKDQIYLIIGASYLTPAETHHCFLRDGHDFRGGHLDQDSASLRHSGEEHNSSSTDGCRCDNGRVPGLL